METSNITIPWTEEIAIRLTDAELLFGVNTTLNRLAEKPELSWHVLSELDWRICPSSASTGETRVAREARSPNGFISDFHIFQGRISVVHDRPMHAP